MIKTTSDRSVPSDRMTGDRGTRGRTIRGRGVGRSTLLQPRALFQGRWLVLTGILLVAFSLRLAVGAVSPLLAAVTGDLPLTATSIGILGMLPTVGFAVMGLTTPKLMQRFEPEPLLLISLLLAAAGQVVRAVAADVPVFLGFSLLTMLGLGLGNVVLPPLIKRYFPDQVGLLTASYVTLFAISTALAPQVAVPVASVSDWRVSIGAWAVVSLIAALPWAMHLMRPSARSSGEDGLTEDGATGKVRIRIWRSPVGWGLALVFMGSSSNAFAMFAWLPPLLMDNGISAAAAGNWLAYYAILALPTALVVPLVAARLRHPLRLAIVIIVACAGGYAGLLLAPTAHTWLWVTLAGFGQGTYSFALVMINLRTRTTHGSGALSGFGQGLGYLLASLGPLLFGVLHDMTGTWAASFGLLGFLLLVLTSGWVIISRPHMVEDRPGVVVPVPQAK